MAMVVDHQSLIISAQRRVNALQQTDPALPEALNDLGKTYQTAFLAINDPQLLDHACLAHQAAADTAASRNDLEHSSKYLVNVGVVYQRLFECRKSEEYLQQSIAVLHQAKGNISGQFLGALLNNLGISLNYLYNCHFQPHDLEACIETYREALELPTSRSTLKLKNNLSNALLLRFELNGTDQDLLEACVLAEEIIGPESIGEPMRARFLDTCASCRSAKGRHQNSEAFLKLALDCSQEAVDIGYELQDERVLFYSINLASVLTENYELSGEPSLLDESIATLKEVENIIESDLAEYPNYLFTAADNFLRRFEARGERDDLEKALNLSTQAASFVDKVNPLEAAQILNHLGNSKLRRYEFLGKEIDIDAAIVAHKQAIKKLGQHSHNVINVSNNLCISHLARYEYSNSIEDLESAFDIASRVINRETRSRYNLASLLVTQGDAFLKAYDATGEMHCLNEAVSSFEAAVGKSAKGERALPGRLSAWSHALQKRFAKLKDPIDIERAIKHSLDAVASTQEHPSLCIHLTTLGNAYLCRCIEKASENVILDLDRDQIVQDLQDAVKNLEMARNLMPSSSVNQGMCLNNLGKAYELLFDLSPLEKYYTNALEAYQVAMDMDTAAPNLRISAGYRGTLFCVSKDISQAAQFAQRSVELFPLLSSLAMRRVDQQEDVRNWAGFASYGAAVLLQAGQSDFQALRLLETGRNVINNKLLQTRTDLEDLHQELPELAKRFEELRNKLNGFSSLRGDKLMPTGRFKFEAESRRQTVRSFETLLNTIRSNAKFKSFLNPPEEKNFKEAVGASDSYIVVINVTSLRSDAIVVSKDRISSLPLPQLTHQDLVQQATGYLEVLEKDNILSRSKTNAMLRSVLKWLWDCAVESILTYLKLENSAHALPRVWWMPVGLLSIFPLHAAGGYNNIPRSSVLDRAISLYTPSIQSLIHSRRKMAAVSSPVRKGLCISMPQTPEMSALPFAELETKQTSALLETTLQMLTLTARTKKDVLEALRTVDIVHFCCHGEVDAENPSESRLLLQDWKSDPLTVADVAALDLKPARFAYLSACHASSTRVVSLLDEGIHLAGAFQMAGFVQTIGTLWQVNDKRATEVAEKVYRFLLADNNGLNLELLADALHDAVRDLREATRFVDDAGFQMEVENQPFTWAPFVCLGL